jgi:hypothetical protein
MNRTVAITATIGVIASLFLLYVYANSSTQRTTIGSQSLNEPFPSKIIRTVRASPWTGDEAKEGKLVAVGSQGSPNGSIVNGTYDGMNNTEGTVNLNDQSYFMTTLDGNLKSIVFNEPSGTAIEFANVTFTFARPPNIPLPSNPIIPVIVQFQDGTSETLNVQIQKDYPQTVLSGHANPRAGITITQGNHLMAGLADNQGNVKLLVSAN